VPVWLLSWPKGRPPSPGEGSLCAPRRYDV
jgi:hypothetical protein